VMRSSSLTPCLTKIDGVRWTPVGGASAEHTAVKWKVRRKKTWWWWDREGELGAALFCPGGGVASRARKGDIQWGSSTSDVRLSIAACKHWITRCLSASELIARPSNRLM
jgi:hypothetical protein